MGGSTGKLSQGCTSCNPGGESSCRCHLNGRWTGFTGLAGPLQSDGGSITLVEPRRTPSSTNLSRATAVFGSSPVRQSSRVFRVFRVFRGPGPGLVPVRIGAGAGNRTRVPCLGSTCDNHYTTPAENRLNQKSFSPAAITNTPDAPPTRSSVSRNRRKARRHRSEGQTQSASLSRAVPHVQAAP